MKLEGQVRIPSRCAISAAISKDGNKMSGKMITNSMKPIHDRSNGLGGGFAGYGIYPEYKDFYAFHMFFDSRGTRKECEAFLKERFEIVHSEIIPTRKIPVITNKPIIWRYFAAPLKSVLVSLQLDEKEFPSLLITGPFSIVLGFEGGLMALNDRLKLRSMVVGEKDDRVFIASEEAAIRSMEPDAENIWSPAGDEPVAVKVKISCRVCEQQCANEAHSYDKKHKIMKCDESKCVNCQRCVSLCPTRV